MRPMQGASGRWALFPGAVTVAGVVIRLLFDVAAQVPRDAARTLLGGLQYSTRSVISAWAVKSHPHNSADIPRPLANASIPLTRLPVSTNARACPALR